MTTATAAGTRILDVVTGWCQDRGIRSIHGVQPATLQLIEARACVRALTELE